MLYWKLVERHMVEYTTSEITDEVKRSKSVPFPHPYILKKRYQRLNVLPQYRKEIFRKVVKGITLRSNSLYLYSSQVMGLNFFYPLVKNNLLPLLLEKVRGDEPWGEVCEWGFEKESDVELDLSRRFPDFGEVATHDFYVETKNGFKVSFVIRYTETSFAGVINYGGMYNPKFEAYQSIMKPLITCGEKWPDIQVNYKMLQRLLFLQDPKRYVVFLVPRGNRRLAGQVQKERNWVSEEMRDHVVVMYWEDLVLWLRSGELEEYYQAFYEKYLNL